jgi:succinate dehydrogenase flavin-adding protein (antitoxin of CptAB toxin-antitoxin module)
LLYRARQRGWLELDLIIGRWAKRNLEEESQALPRSVIRDLELLLTQENPDLFKWLTGQLPTPSEMLQNSAFRMIKADLDRGIEINGSPKASTPAGTAWVRGWGDTGTTPSGSSAPFERGNQE